MRKLIIASLILATLSVNCNDKEKLEQERIEKQEAKELISLKFKRNAKVLLDGTTDLVKKSIRGEISKDKCNAKIAVMMVIFDSYCKQMNAKDLAEVQEYRMKLANETIDLQVEKN
ncbi:hypothetical protein SAMN05444372_10982 [Flavobacterium micromati]|jgi:hypothetical protein|uniref:Uncharacterized protein n=1 Tax=Flavobacterium micromati TaxID=229205 RepID=A0A1M5M8W8_9FLAO|nr:hypothetical protein [Flavobacterium micromati]SHG73409.1 hypothetical protein SAMN05444372_10982 [Flavobacterium micromati]